MKKLSLESALRLMSQHYGNLNVHRLTSIVELSEDITYVNNNLIISTRLSKLPDNLTVCGDLIIKYSKNNNLTELPNNLTVGRNLYIYPGTNIEKLPSNLILGGGLFLDKTKIKELPDNLSVINGDLTITGTDIKRFPDRLIVSGNLCIINSKIANLPDNTIVCNSLTLRKVGIKELPDNIIIGNNIDLQYSGIQRLPDNIKIGYKGYRYYNSGNMYITDDDISNITTLENGDYETNRYLYANNTIYPIEKCIYVCGGLPYYIGIFPRKNILCVNNNYIECTLSRRYY
jgi:hypothetical protein